MLEFNPPIIGHRGASAYAPENTLAAFTKAVQMGLDWIEFDVCFSKDAVPVIFHDKYLRRITGKFFRPCDYTFNQLRAMDAGTWFHPRFASERILSLEHALQFIRDKKISANIEIKQLQEKEMVHLKGLVSLVQQYFPSPSKQILYSSFSTRALHAMRELDPKAHIGLLMHRWRHNWQELADKLDCVSVNLNDAIVDELRVKSIKKESKKVLVYTVNSANRAKVLYECGVDAVFSDYPDLLELNNTL